MSHHAHDHAHDHGHDHAHHHGVSPQDRDRVIGPLKIVFFLNLSFCGIEAAAGLWTNSLALLADAGHMLVDVLAVGMSLGAAWLAKRPATSKSTYGFYRVEILAALINGMVLWGLVLWIWVEAFHRFHQLPDILAGPMLAVAVVGLIINIISGLVLHRVSHASLNVHGAFLHVVFDMLGSVAAILAGICLLWKGWKWVDPLLSILTAALIVWGAWKLILEALEILMERAPGHIDVAALRRALLEVEGVQEVHDLHVWTLTSGFEAMTGHAVIRDIHRSPMILEQARRLLADRFHIEHMTLQLELPEFGKDVLPLRRLAP